MSFSIPDMLPYRLSLLEFICTLLYLFMVILLAYDFMTLIIKEVYMELVLEKRSEAERLADSQVEKLLTETRLPGT